MCVKGVDHWGSRKCEKERWRKIVGGGKGQGKWEMYVCVKDELHEPRLNQDLPNQSQDLKGPPPLESRLVRY